MKKDVNVDTNFDLKALEEIVIRALDEDLGDGDITTEWTISTNAIAHAFFEAKQPGIISGLYPTDLVYKRVDSDLEFKPLLDDGDSVEPGQPIAEVRGAASSVLTGERTALNFLRHLSGIATMTSEYANAIQNTDTKIVDTRKTTPGLRILEKRAVVHGGGHNHRFGLYDMVLIKDNHIAASGGIGPAVRLCRSNMKKAGKRVDIEVETSDLAQVAQAVCHEADWIMLDNMSDTQMSEAVQHIRANSPPHHPIIIEASGMITLSRLKSVAKTGVQVISIGALTHSAPVLDISLNIGPST